MAQCEEWNRMKKRLFALRHDEEQKCMMTSPRERRCVKQISIFLGKEGEQDGDVPSKKKRAI